MVAPEWRDRREASQCGRGRTSHAGAPSKLGCLSMRTAGRPQARSPGTPSRGEVPCNQLYHTSSSEARGTPLEHVNWAVVKNIRVPDMTPHTDQPLMPTKEILPLNPSCARSVDALLPTLSTPQRRRRVRPYGGDRAGKRAPQPSADSRTSQGCVRRRSVKRRKPKSPVGRVVAERPRGGGQRPTVSTAVGTG